MPVDAEAVASEFPHGITVVERSYEADRNAFLLVMLLMLTVIVWILLLQLSALWDTSRPFEWSGVAHICLLGAAAYITWKQHRVYHHDWALGW